MATQSVKKSSNRKSPSWRIQMHRLPLGTRRGAATIVEVSLVVASALVPYSIGLAAKFCTNAGACVSQETVPLNPVLATTEDAIAQTLAIPRRASNQRVAPLTNLFWCGALVAPVLVVGWQLYKLGKTGQTSPKRWLGVQVVQESGDPPGLIRAIWREGVGRWGLPLSTAYLIWRYSGAFPDLGILLGLSALMWLGENAIALFNPERRTLHDRIAGTFVIDGARAFVPDRSRNAPQLNQLPGTEQPAKRARETITSIALTSQSSKPSSKRSLRLWDWMRQNPSLTLIIVGFSCMSAVLGTFVGTQMYIQNQANWRSSKQQNNQVFLALVERLSRSSPNQLEERRSAILALARLDDSRAIPFLVDLLGQERVPALMETIGQTLVSTGPEALPYLQRLNLSLQKDEALLQGSGFVERQLIAKRLVGTQRAIAKILSIYPTQVHKVDLSRTDLAQVRQEPAPFTLVLDKADLSGILFKGASLTGASLRNSRFLGAGEDGRLGTFDDWITDFNGADLKEANLSGALLSRVPLNRTNLIRATLNRANLSQAQLVGANLSSAKLIGADLRQAVLENASLTGADLANANFTQSNLSSARLGQVSAVGAKFPFALLTNSNWQGADLSEADFQNANLQKADLSATRLVGANLAQAQLQNANLQNTNLSAADLRGANLAGANLKGATFAAPKPVQSDQFIQEAPNAASLARVQGVEFSQVKNLDAKQIGLICDQGGRHPRCQ
ncbi:pentapeptide repeat-containing protein [Coleofasciculus sp. FACHB-T130]|uniref:pentapeptide repeat-containing protein n=1 Tax=Cyanophyceae TaxID=3028117 RepID=UPI001687CF23|nr:pentapeptide repeat-containing protein [Coleofasciculus sp. FACHB-T130]MBD1879277.1 pentapeptide repeat-containing protein [Coleofasciculus sp. FACHB-T130]